MPPNATVQARIDQDRLWVKDYKLRRTVEPVPHAQVWKGAPVSEAGGGGGGVGFCALCPWEWSVVGMASAVRVHERNAQDNRFGQRVTLIFCVGKAAPNDGVRPMADAAVGGGNGSRLG